MATNNSLNIPAANNSDGFDLTGGTTARKLTVTGADITLTGSGTNVYTFPSSTDTIVGLSCTQTLTNKTLTAATTTTTFTPTASDGCALGTSASMFSDLFLASGGVINFANGEATITETTADVITLAGADLKVSSPGNVANSVVTTDGSQGLTGKTYNKVTITAPATGSTLTIADGLTLSLTGASATIAGSGTAVLTMPTITDTIVGCSATATLSNKLLDAATASTTLTPTSADGCALGTSASTWSDLFLASGGVINWANGEATLTETTADVITLAGADLKVSSPGSVANSVVTTDATQTLSNKTYELGENTPIRYDGNLSGDTKYSGMTRECIAGAALSFGSLVYYSPADSRWEKVDATSASTAGGMLGIAVQAVSGDGCDFTCLYQGFVNAAAVFPALAVGYPVYAGNDSGTVSASTATLSGSGCVIRKIGFAVTGDEMYFNPDNYYTIV